LIAWATAFVSVTLPSMQIRPLLGIEWSFAKTAPLRVTQARPTLVHSVFPLRSTAPHTTFNLTIVVAIVVTSGGPLSEGRARQKSREIG
jgi:hypothetical protein